MAAQPLQTLIRSLHRAAGQSDDGSLTDGELLECWAAHRDQAAFELLLWRHGPMVLCTCRRLLADPHEAEDAFQAAWLVLLRKAGSVRRPEALAAWLHRVTVRVALRARASAARQRNRERPGLVEVPAAALPDDVAGRDLRSVLDGEIDQLPGHQRQAFVLCCLEGKSYADVAAQLGRPQGTVASWAARARQRLRARLERRGVAGAAGAAVVGLTGDATAAGLPATLLASTLGAVPTGTVSARTAALAEGVLRAIFLTRLKTTVAVLVTAVAVAVGATRLIHQMRADVSTASSASARASANPAVLTKKRGPLLRVPMPDRTMMTAALSANGSLLAVSRHDRTTVQLWDVRTGKEQTLTGHAFSVTALAFSPDSKTLASATGSWLPDGAPGEIKLWNVATGKELASLGKLPTSVLALAFSPDGKLLASASKTVKLWNLAARKEERDFAVGREVPWSVAFAPDGKTLAAGVGVLEDNTPGSVFLWNLATGKQRAILSGHVGAVPCVAFTPDGRTLASADTKGTVKLWDVAGAKVQTTIPNPGHTFLLQSLVVTSDGRRVVASRMGPHGTDLEVWDVATGKERSTYPGTLANGFPLALSGNGARVLLGSHPPAEGSEGNMELWELRALPRTPAKPEEPPAGALSEKRKPAEWLADASRADIPDQAAAGRLHGKPFRVGRARITPHWSTSGTVGDPPEKQDRWDGAVLWLHQEKDVPARNQFTIFLTVPLNDMVDGKTFVVPPGGLFKQTDKLMGKDGKSWSYPVEGVQTQSRDASGKRRDDLMPKVTMRLELGRRKSGWLSGKIYLCIDDKEKTFVAGSFKAKVEEKPDLEDAKKLFGTWQATGGETSRRKLSAAEVRATQMSFDYVDTILREGSRTIEANYRLDPEKSPKQIDLTLKGPKNKGKKVLGIYHLEDDSLTLCVGEAGQSRPDKFKAGDKPPVRLLRFRRAQAGKD